MIRIYELHADDWYGVGEPADNLLWDSRIVVEEETWEMACKSLALMSNNDELDVANSNLFIQER